jgi:hypothetical protein
MGSRPGRERMSRNLCGYSRSQSRARCTRKYAKLVTVQKGGIKKSSGGGEKTHPVARVTADIALAVPSPSSTKLEAESISVEDKESSLQENISDIELAKSWLVTHVASFAIVEASGVRADAIVVASGIRAVAMVVASGV